MAEAKVSDIKKNLNGILKLNKKYVTTERLSRVVGVYPEIIADHLKGFDATIPMDPDFNLMEIVQQMKEFINDKEEEKSQAVKKPAIHKSDLNEYESIQDFIYRKLTYGGVVDRNATLSDRDLRILKKLIQEEQNKRKK